MECDERKFGSLMRNASKSFLDGNIAFIIYIKVSDVLMSDIMHPSILWGFIKLDFCEYHKIRHNYLAHS